MFSDEQIEQGRQLIADVVGSWRADWYAEACRLEYDTDGAIGDLMVACDTATIEFRRTADALRPHNPKGGEHFDAMAAKMIAAVNKAKEAV